MNKDKIHFAGMLLELNDAEYSPIHRRIGRKQINLLKEIRKQNVIDEEDADALNNEIIWLDGVYKGYITERWKQRKRKLDTVGDPLDLTMYKNVI